MKSANALILIITFVNLVFTVVGYVNFVTVGVNTFCLGWVINNIIRSQIYHD